MSNTKWYQLEPTDAWFFRDGRPSNLGEDQSDLESLFPPHASTIVGAIRAALARNCPHDWDGKSDWSDEIKTVLGDGFDCFGELSFQCPFLMKEDELLFPAPGHLLGEIEERKFRPKSFLKPSQDKICCDLGNVYLPVANEGESQSDETSERLKSPEGFFITTSGMNQVLKGSLPVSEQLIHQSELYVLESRVGIEREEKTRTTKKGALYSPQYIRLAKGVTLVVGIAGLPEKWKLPSYFPLGGESRLAACDPVDSPPQFPKAETDNCDMLILVTLAHFSGSSWYGANPGDDALHINKDLSGKVKTAMFDRPTNIGGWDSRKGKTRGPLPMQPYVPAGAIWWLEESLKLSDAETSLSLGDRTVYGYGIALPGKSTS